VPGVHLPGAKALAVSFAMNGFAGYSAPGKTHGKRPFAKDFCILPGLLPLVKCNISCSVLKYLSAEFFTENSETDQG